MSLADKARYGRACLLVLNVCTFTLRHVIDDYALRHGSLSLWDFLEKNKDNLFHFLYRKKCCCRPRPNRATPMYRWYWDQLFVRNTSSCMNGMQNDCPCKYVAKPGITTNVMNLVICCLIIKNICQGVDINHIKTIREIRNNLIHADRASLDLLTYNRYWNRVKTAICALAKNVSTTLHIDTLNKIDELSEFRNLVVDNIWITDLEADVTNKADDLNQTRQEMTQISTYVSDTPEKVTQISASVSETTEKVIQISASVSKTNEKVFQIEEQTLRDQSRASADLHECSLDKDVSEILLDAKREYVGTELLLCRDSEGNAVIIGYNSTMSLSKIEIPGKYRGKLRIKNPRNVSDEAFKASTYGLENKIRLNDWEEDILQSCIARHSSRLWGEHSNLTMISGDCVKYTTGLPEVKFCVVLCCLSKGYIPFDERPFPRVLNEKGHDIEVDVREGYFLFGPTDLIGRMNHWNDPVCMGSSIGNKKDKKNGSVGFFVNLPNNGIGFITCCHVLFDCIHSRCMDNYYRAPDRTRPDHDAFFTVQPSLNSLDCGIDKDQRICGFVERAVFKPECDPVSVDAALVRMTDRKPGTGHFTISVDTRISEAGYDEKKPPLYNGGKILCKITSNEREKPLIKSGTRTGLTKGEFKMNGLEVSIPEDGAFLGDSALHYPKRVMKGQYEVRSSMTFFDLGDSGSAVFLKDPDGSLKCVGMAIGRTSFYTTVVTPIGAILQALGLQEQDMTNFREPMNLG